jgi:hypothetical protein
MTREVFSERVSKALIHRCLRFRLKTLRILAGREWFGSELEGQHVREHVRIRRRGKRGSALDGSHKRGLPAYVAIATRKLNLQHAATAILNNANSANEQIRSERGSRPGPGALNAGCDLAHVTPEHQRSTGVASIDGI